MSQFTCDSLRDYFSAFLGTCSFATSAERQRKSRDKLDQQKALLLYEIKQLDGQIEECERRKASLLAQARTGPERDRQKRVNDAKDVVTKKHKLLKKRDKSRELHDFTDTLLEQLTDTSTLTETMSTISEAQRLYLSIDQTKIYSRYARLADKFGSTQSEVRDRMDEAQAVLSSHLTATASDDDLLRELTECDNTGGDALPPSPQATVITPPPVMGISGAYARAGLQANF